MRLFPTLASVSMLAMLAACGHSADGYYDANGRYQYYNSSADSSYIPDTMPRDRARNDGRRYGNDITQHDRDSAAYHHANRHEGTYSYDRRGYYDFNGNYMDENQDSLSVPAKMFPPRGMCRVWFTDRMNNEQPRAESCNRINERVPAAN